MMVEGEALPCWFDVPAAWVVQLPQYCVTKLLVPYRRLHGWFLPGDAAHPAKLSLRQHGREQNGAVGRHPGLGFAVGLTSELVSSAMHRS